MAEHPPETAEQREERFRAMYEDLLSEPNADSMDITVNRDLDLLAPGKTFSVEGLGDLRDSIATFIAARVARHWQDKPGGTGAVGPSRIRAEVRLTIDGEHREPAPDRRPWFVIDGQRRAG